MQNESKIFSLRKTQYLSLIDEINQKVTDKLSSKKLIKNQLEESKSKITNEEFLIAFVGDWSSGKSSLINKILFDEYSQKGVDFLPVLDERTTTRITRIQYGEKTKMFILKNDGSKELLADGEEKVMAALKEHASTQGSKSEKDSGEYRLLIEHPAEILRSGIVFVDTPGLQDEDHSSITEDEMHYVDAVVLVFPFNLPFTQAMDDFLQKRVWRSSIQKIFFLLNKCDRISTDDDVDKNGRINYTYDTIRDKSQEYAASFREFLTGSKDFLYDDIKKDHFFGVSAKTGEGLAEFCKKLADFTDGQDKNIALYNSAKSRIEMSLSTLRNEISDKENSIGKDKNVFDRQIEQQNLIQEEIKKQWNQTIQVFNDEYKDFSKKIYNDLETFLKSMVEEAETFFEKEKSFWRPGKTSKKLNEKIAAFNKKIDIKIKRSLREVEEKKEDLFIKLLDRLDSILKEVNFKILQENQQSIEEQDVNANPLIAGTFGGAAIGLSVGAATGALTTTTLVFPGGLALYLSSGLSASFFNTAFGAFVAKSVGISVTATLSSAAVLMYALPAGAVAGILIHTGTLLYSSEKINESFDSFKAHLENLSTSIPEQFNEMLTKDLKETKYNLIKYMNDDLNVHIEKIKSLSEYAEMESIPPEIKEAKELIENWSNYVSKSL
ncbi:MAG TPA: dynamin family protein [bacterium]|nr:dynamin family protein [bacterium]